MGGERDSEQANFKIISVFLAACQRKEVGFGSPNWRLLSANCKVLFWPILCILQVSFHSVCSKICLCVG
jgi:hypothetical protein